MLLFLFLSIPLLSPFYSSNIYTPPLPYSLPSLPSYLPLPLLSSPPLSLHYTLYLLSFLLPYYSSIYLLYSISLPSPQPLILLSPLPSFFILSLLSSTPSNHPYSLCHVGIRSGQSPQRIKLEILHLISHSIYQVQRLL